MDINKILAEENSNNDSFAFESDEKIFDINSLLKSNINKNSISMSFETLVNKFNEFDFILPKYQRKYVWDREQIANLALSLIKNIPIPPIYVYFNEIDNKYVILDGQQRMISLFLYYNDLNIKRTKDGNKILIDFYELLSIPKQKTLLDALKNSEININNTKYRITEGNEDIDITYGNLQSEAKRLLGSKYIEIVFLEIQSDNKEKVYSNIFKLLNSAGTPLKPQEIRNGVFQSLFYDELHNLNTNNTTWRTLYGEKHETSRDVELLLRFLALDDSTELNLLTNKISFKENIYRGSYNLLLDDFSQKSLISTKNQINVLIDNLNTFFEKFNLSGSQLENRKNKIVNHLLLEALYVSFIKLDKKIDIFDENIITNILNNDYYKAASQNSTSNKSNIENRINIVYEAIKNEIY